MIEKKYYPSLISLYINYFVHGMGAIILAQNSVFLQEQLGTDNAGISFIISALGIGRLAVLYISGVLSDKFGRRPFVLIGIVAYIVFFVGIIFAPNVGIAFLLALSAGAANSFLDSGCIPAVMEIMDKMTGTASVLTKLFMSMGQFVLPLVISFIVGNGLYFGYSFIFCAALLVLNFVISKTSVANVILFDILITAIGVVLAVVVNIRYNRLNKADKASANVVLES